jgi:transcriptional regulator with XRE-family HTH domain
VAEPVDVAVLGERLKRARTARAATLKEVAEQAEISIATLSRIERGNAKSVDGPTLLALAKWIGATAQEFLERPDVPTGRVPEQTTPDVVELHLRADKRLDKRTAMALAKMFRAAYDSLAHQQRAQRKKA